MRWGPRCASCIGKRWPRVSVRRSGSVAHRAGSNVRKRRNAPTPAKKTKAMRMPGSRLTSGTRSARCAGQLAQRRACGGRTGCGSGGIGDFDPSAPVLGDGPSFDTDPSISPEQEEFVVATLS